ncbi:MAG: ABC transporter permease subunit [Pseudohongiellaceae bacterium]
MTIVGNTVKISLLSMVFGFPTPIILAIFLNEIRGGIFKLSVQMVTAVPHFISTVVMSGLILVFLQPTGLVGKQMRLIGLDASVSIMGVADLFKYIYAISDMWQHMGYNSIIYLAALSGINPELYEAAKVDGANLMKKIIHVDLPGIMPVIIILFILNTGEVLQVGFEKTFLLQNNLNLPGSEVLQTFVYKVGLLNANYSYSTAIGLFNAAVSFGFLVSVNYIVRKYSESSLW